MNNIDLRKLIPHLIAIGIFLLAALILCSPALEKDVVIKQQDHTSWEAMSHQSFEFKEKYGHFPLWITNMFSGMPAFQIATDSKWSPIVLFNNLFQLWLPQPMNFFFLACICFYFLCLCLRIRPFIAVIAALLFAYCSYSAIIISAGHNTKMMAMAYSPAVIGAMVLLLDKKYLAGFVTLLLFVSLQVCQGHQQITYYLFFILAGMVMAYFIRFILQKEYLHMLKSLGLMSLAGIIGISVSALTLLPVYDYSKESKRGGQLMMADSGNKKDKMESGKTKGLSKDYAFQWSMGKSEVWTMLIPGAMGYGLHYAERDGETILFPQLSENSKSLEAFQELGDPQMANQLYNTFQQRIYWGDQPFTNGPTYLGVLACLLFFLGMVLLDNKHKWWVLGVSGLAVLLSWGDHFPAFNYWVFDNVPLYNKFRAPAMILIIPQILFPLLGALTLEKIVSSEGTELLPGFKKAMVGFACVLALAFFSINSMGYTNENTVRTREFKKIFNQSNENPSAILDQKGQSFASRQDNRLFEMIAMSINAPSKQEMIDKAGSLMNALKEDRKSFFISDFFKSLLLSLLAAILLFQYLSYKKELNMKIMLGGLLIIGATDLLSFDSKYINKLSFEIKDAYEAGQFTPTEADKMIMSDPDPNFRVLNTGGLDEARTSYFHKAIGGYHPAKLGIYDDLIAYQLNNNMNPAVVNMLNAKYVIQDQNNRPVAMRNPEALGNAWFVKDVIWKKNASEEMKGLYGLNPVDTAVADEKFKALAGAFGAGDSTDYIRMTQFNNDTVRYESNCKNARIAVFSEIYYKDWQAYIDGKPVPHFKANYVLRAMNIPAGKYAITFQFEPKIFYLGMNISIISSWLVSVIFMLYIIYFFRQGDTGFTTVKASGQTEEKNRKKTT